MAGTVNMKKCMVQKTELRIGNWVVFNDDTDRNGQIIELHEHSAKMRCDYIPDHQENKVYEVETDYENLWPIRLTLELLDKCGFAKDEGGNYMRYKDFAVYINGPSTSFSFKTCVWNGDYVVKYLYQLQNLYFALTGEELNVKLS